MNYANHWIRLSDELPPFDTPVFFTTRDDIRIGTISDGPDGWLFADVIDCPYWIFVSGGKPCPKWVCDEGELDDWSDFKPTHWLPFPEPRRRQLPMWGGRMCKSATPATLKPPTRACCERLATRADTFATTEKTLSSPACRSCRKSVLTNGTATASVASSAATRIGWRPQNASPVSTAYRRYTLKSRSAASWNRPTGSTDSRRAKNGSAKERSRFQSLKQGRRLLVTRTHTTFTSGKSRTPRKNRQC